MAIKTSSAKAKGRNLQQWVVKQLLKAFPKLEEDDIRSTSMGASGEDVQLSPLARKSIPYSIECKARANIAVYSYYKQAKENCPEKSEPLVFIKANRERPLALIDAEYFMELIK